MALATTEPEPVTEPEAAAEEEAKASADISAMARGGLLNLVGAAGTGLFTFALVTVLTRGLGAASYGAFVSAMGLFTVLSNTAELGADTGLVRFVSRLRALDRVRDIRRTVYVAVLPPLVVGTIFGVAMWFWAPELAHIFGKGQGQDQIAEFARWMAPFLPAGGIVLVILSGTRGFGTMVPTVTVDRIGRPFVQCALALGIILVAGAGHANHGLIALSWAVPQLIGAVIGFWWFWGLLLKAERKDRRQNGRRRSRPTTVLANRFWRFTSPRGMAGIFQIVVLWFDTLLVGRLDSTEAAGIYNAATRYITAGLMVGVAIQQVAGPKLSELMAQRSWDRARGVYQTTTAWLMVATWPLYFTFGLFAPTLLRVFGHGFKGGAGALEVLGFTMLAATAVGTVDMVLLMGGKSSWNLINTMVGLTLNVGLNLLLIPHFGGTGAAIAWSTSILVTNGAPLIQVWKFLGMHPFGQGFPKVVLASGAAYGALGLVLRVGLGT
ncbi:MAG TPA: polysaccharide biosynthesis C-terminal domain-containing protein, partial [Acidimicrobiia bacterium]|nr:polysaccharide biosynthesis C-terminal domain-containing protein [Acidimicrobiia bacterium]